MSESDNLADLLGTGPETTFPKKSGGKNKKTTNAEVVKTSHSKSIHVEEIEQKSLDKSNKTEDDNYLVNLKKALASTGENTNEKFKSIFIARFCLEPQIDRDTKLKSILDNSHQLSIKEWMILTQKHFNEFGGFDDNL